MDAEDVGSGLGSEFFPDAANVALDGALAGIGKSVPDLVHDLIGMDHGALAGEKKAQDFEFLEAEVNGLAVHSDFIGRYVDFNLFVLDCYFIVCHSTLGVG